MKKDYLFNSGVQLMDKDYDEFIWVTDMWSHLDRQLVQYFGGEEELKGTAIILEGAKEKVIDKQEEIDEDDDVWTNFTKKIKGKKSNKTILVVNKHIRNDDFYIEQFSLKNDTSWCFNAKPAIDKQKDNKRFKRFLDMARFSDILIIPPMSEKNKKKYDEIHSNVITMPLVSNVELKANDVDSRKSGIKYIDFCLTGTITEHRLNIIRLLRQKGYTVTVTGIHTPEYIREELYKASWVDLCPLLSGKSESQSITKAKYNLDRNHIHLFEKPMGGEEWKNGILKYVTVSQDNYVDEAIHLLEKAKKRRAYYINNEDYISYSNTNAEKFNIKFKKAIGKIKE